MVQNLVSMLSLMLTLTLRGNGPLIQETSFGQVHAEVESWDLPALQLRYEHACKSAKQSKSCTYALFLEINFAIFDSKTFCTDIEHDK